MTKKGLPKWVLIVFGASILMVAAGGYGLYRAFEIPLEAIIVLENRTDSPVEDVRVTYGGKVLFCDPSFESVAVLAYLRPEEEKTAVELTFRRAGEASPETFSFLAKHEMYSEQCAFLVRIVDDGAQMLGCFSYHINEEAADSSSKQTRRR